MFITRYPVIQADKTGEQFIQCAYEESPCGCKVIGGGTLQQPLKIKYCEKHDPIKVAILTENLTFTKAKLHKAQETISKRNAQIKRLKKEVQECYAEIAQLIYKINNR